MLYDIVRLIFFLIILGLGFLLLRRLKATRKLFIIVPLSILWMGLFLASSSFPVENLFINFKSPEAVFYYTKSGKIESVVYGNDSCMINYFSGTTLTVVYIPKLATGYKIPGPFISRTVSQRIDVHASCVFTVDNVKNTNDYYISGGIIPSGSDMRIFDKDGDTIGTFTRIVTPSVNISYAYVHNLPDGAYALINGEKVLIAN